MDAASGHYLLQVLSRRWRVSPAGWRSASCCRSRSCRRRCTTSRSTTPLSHPIDTQHSWTYPGFGCGTLLKPQFSASVLYAQAQNLAFYQATHNPQLDPPADQRGSRAGGYPDHQGQLRPADAERARLHAGQLQPALVRRALAGSPSGDEDGDGGGGGGVGGTAGPSGLGRGAGRAVAAISSALST